MAPGTRSATAISVSGALSILGIRLMTGILVPGLTFAAFTSSSSVTKECSGVALIVRFLEVVTSTTAPLYAERAIAWARFQETAPENLSIDRTRRSTPPVTIVSQLSSSSLTGYFRPSSSKSESTVVSLGFPSRSTKTGSPWQTLFPVPDGPMSAVCLK